MKCPICGKEEFIESPYSQIEVSGDATLNTKGLKSFVCTNCGYLILIDTNIKEFMYANKEKIEILTRQVASHQNAINELRKSSTDLSDIKDKLEKAKEQLRTRREWGEDNKATRALEEGIAEYTSRLNKGVKEEDLRKIKELEAEISRLEHEIALTKNMFKPVLQEVKPVKHLKDFEEEDIFDAKRIWKTLINVYQQNDPNNSNTLSISDSLAKSMYHVMTIYHLAKERGYRPYPFNDGQTLIVIDEKEKEKLKRPYVNIYTFDEFIKSKK